MIIAESGRHVSIHDVDFFNLIIIILELNPIMVFFEFIRLLITDSKNS
jgi:hypothetical protein